jgi:hypothetical protein
MSFSIRFDSSTEKAIARLARRRRQSKAAVVREALAAWQIQSKATPEVRTPAEALAPFIGVANSRGSHTSENTGDAFRALVERKRARRTR